ncbi:hypothetical protein AGABI2DRAFT_119011 [Agaricus bisporus var. bisporus H97]|uniref:hypothetical protein n=1 Tax=Agaricus bisporus var. bisporus (strain H97 / ATCC MYA-4626 / FGSC 10389) TaxID=936046 RepID=UPI00029F7DBC|nr:hypothetical protein AGABI2DRAFT_119011 [Agaricus bisporus var. bisporus H97]EKV46829.1 hypothetical protein AGABI2DRAFT_119011 [Agaricus bisporus var. bisporus H97]
MPESVHSASASQIPNIPEPLVLRWTPSFDEDDDVVYIAGAAPTPVAPPPSLASASTSTLSTIREHPLPPPPPSFASEGTHSHTTSTVSLAHATIGDHDSNSRRVSMFSQPSMALGAAPAIEEHPLPDSHVEDQVPTYPMTYTFTPVEGDSETMILVPSTATSNSHAVYHIRVTHDLFDPSFFITTIKKGGTSDGRLVGDFTTKQDCSAFEETVFYKNIENRIFTKLIVVKKDEYHWKMRGGAELLVWKWDKNWTCQHVPAQSPSKNKRYPIIAQFFPYVLRSPSNPHKIAHMTVQPSGQQFFDDIILSLLIVERKRKKLPRR